MMDEDREPRRNAGGSQTARRLTGLLTGIGLAIAAGALFGIGVLGPSRALLVLFWCGWVVITVTMLAALLTVRTGLPIDEPLKVIRFGLVTVVLGFGLEHLSGAPMRPLWGFGALTMMIGIGWALWNLGGMRE